MILGMCNSPVVCVRDSCSHARRGNTGLRRSASCSAVGRGASPAGVPTRSMGTRQVENLPHLVVQDGEDVFLAHQQQLFVADLECLAGPRAKEHSLANLYLKLAAAAVVQQLAVADGFDNAAGRLLLGAVWQDDAASRPLLAFCAL